MIKWVDVESSVIKKVGYYNNQDNIPIMRIVFNNGSIYNYFNVSENEFVELVNSESVGKYYHNNIKGIFVSTKAENDNDIPFKKEIKTSEYENSDEEFFNKLKGKDDKPKYIKRHLWQTNNFIMPDVYIVNEFINEKWIVYTIHKEDIFTFITEAKEDGLKVVIHKVGEPVIDWS